jgi:hypothetical protein
MLKCDMKDWNGPQQLKNVESASPLNSEKLDNYLDFNIIRALLGSWGKHIKIIASV